MGPIAYELIGSLLAIGGITVGYVAYVFLIGVPQPGSFVGHSIGILGFLMMLSTETLYSLRKHWPNFNYGRMSIWLQAHVFTGLVGPYLVLLHSGWKFNGLAGVLTLMTGLVVLSGLIGRYIYTAAPRNLEGAEVAVFELEEKIEMADRKLKEQGFDQLGDAVLAAATDHPGQGWWLVVARPFVRWRQRRRLRDEIAKLDPRRRAKAAKLETIVAERQRLQMEIDSLDVTRRLLAMWHLIHIPLSAALFAVAFIHVFGAMYYATFLR